MLLSVQRLVGSASGPALIISRVVSCWASRYGCGARFGWILLAFDRVPTVPRFQPLVLATVVDPGGFPTRTGRSVGRWRPVLSSAGAGLIVSSTDSLTLRSETPANVARHPQGAVNGHRRGFATGPEGLSPRFEDGKEPVRVSSVVVAVTLGTALTRFGEAVRVFGVLHTLWCRSVPI